MCYTYDDMMPLGGCLEKLQVLLRAIRTEHGWRQQSKLIDIFKLANASEISVKHPAQ